MKLSTVIKQASASLAAVAAVSMLTLAPTASAIPYTADSPGTTYPAFNVFTGVPAEGNEADFLRGKEEGDSAASKNDVQSACESGTKYTLRVYVHNSANQTLNEGGTGIARNTKVKVALPGQTEASNFALNSTISASNATSVSDGMTITCADGTKVTLSYVPGSAKQFTGYTGTKALSDSIVTTGAPIGTKNPDGNVEGCFAQRVYVTLTVKVEKAEKPVTPEEPEQPQKPEQPEQPVTPGVGGPDQPTPTVLPETGAGDVALAVLAVTTASTVAYYVVVRRSTAGI